MTENKCREDLKLDLWGTQNFMKVINRLIPLSRKIDWQGDTFRELSQLIPREIDEVEAKYRPEAESYEQLLKKLDEEHDDLSERLRKSLKERVMSEGGN